MAEGAPPNVSKAVDETRWRDLLAATADAIIEFDSAGVVTWASPSIEDLLGWPPDDVVGTIFRPVLPEDEEAIAETSVGVMRDRLPRARYRVRSVCRDGSVKWTDTVVRFQWSADGRLESTVASIRDLSDLISAENERDESAHRFRLAMRHSAIGMTIVAADGRLIEVNPALCEMLRRTESDLLAASWQELTHPDDLVADEALVTEVITGDRDSYRLLKRYLRPDRSVVWGDLSVACVREPSGSVKYFISQIVDVTEQVTSREALAESERRYRLLAENSSDVVLRMSPDGVIEWVSPSCVELFGRTPEQLLGTRNVDLIAPDHRPRFLAEVQEVVRTAGDSRFRFPILRPDGSRRWVESVGRKLTDPGAPPGRIVRLRDIDDEHRAECELRATRDRLRAVLDAQLDPHVTFEMRRDASGMINDLVYATVNPAAAAYLQRDPGEVLGKGVREVFGDGEASANLIGWCTSVLESGEPVALDDAQFVSAVSGTQRHFDIRITGFAPGSVSVTWRDVSDRHDASARLAESERQYRLLADSASDVVIRVSGDVVRWVSPSLTAALGWDPEEWVGRRFQDLVHPDDVTAAEGHNVDIAAGDTRIVRLRVRHRDDSFHWVEVHAAPFEDSDGRPDGVIGSFRVIDDRVEAERALEFQAGHDHLTGLLNRSEISREITRIQNDRRDVAGRRTYLAFVDLDDLKFVNDEFGHQTGDELLRVVSRRVVAALRTDDLVARIGGDEILVVLADIRGTADAVAVMETVLESVNRQHPFDDVVLRPRVSIGLTPLAAEEPVDVAIARADQAMYLVKSTGGNKVALLEHSV